MAVFKCKMCGGDLNVSGNEKVVECEYCGSKQTVPNSAEEKKVNLFNRANRLRMASEFDKAAGIYEQIIAEFPEEAEAYWGLCLSNYGIEYVDDPATGNKIPTCHRASFEKMRKDENYELALENADMAARIVYEDQSKEIDRIMGEILAVSHDEKPYDIFICYKETDNRGNRTADSVLAQDIYDALSAKGYRVFFSRISLEDKLGTQYEPYIFSALNSAKIMLVVGTDYEYMNAAWVKNEWSRFIKLMARDKSKVLIPCYKVMDPYDMPDEFKPYQSQDCGKIGSLQDLTRGIDKIFGRAAESVQKETVQVVAGVGSQTEPLLKRAFMFLEDKEWESAEEYCERVLDIDPENAEAYLGKFLAAKHLSRESDIAHLQSSSGLGSNYSKMMRYADEALKARINGYVAAINKRIKLEKEEIERKTMEAEEQKKAQKAEAEDIYCQLICIQIEKEKTALISKTAALSEKHEQMKALQSKMQDMENQIALNKKQLDSLGLFALSQRKELNQKIEGLNTEKLHLTNEINDLQREGDTLSAEIKKLGSVEDLERKTVEILKKAGISQQGIENGIAKNEAEPAIEQGKEKKKLTIPEIISEIETKEHILRFIKDDSKKTKALASFSDLPLKLYILLGISTFFGNYQEKYGDEAPIEWMILNEQGGKVLLISKYAIACKQYNPTRTDITWEKCSLRSWLNEVFLNDAFSADEQAKIEVTTVGADRNPKYKASPGNATNDKVFLLSTAEVERYFKTKESRKCAPTAYACTLGADTSNIDRTASGEYTCRWWLRSPGRNQDIAALVASDGSIAYNGEHLFARTIGVRPAMWINLG